MQTGGLTFPHGTVGSLEMRDKEGLQSYVDYLMPLVPEVGSPSLPPPLQKQARSWKKYRKERERASKRVEEQSVEWQSDVTDIACEGNISPRSRDFMTHTENGLILSHVSSEGKVKTGPGSASVTMLASCPCSQPGWQGGGSGPDVDHRHLSTHTESALDNTTSFKQQGGLMFREIIAQAEDWFNFSCQQASILLKYLTALSSNILDYHRELRWNSVNFDQPQQLNYGPFYVRGADTLDPELVPLQGCLEGVQSQEWESVHRQEAAAPCQANISPLETLHRGLSELMDVGEEDREERTNQLILITHSAAGWRLHSMCSAGHNFPSPPFYSASLTARSGSRFKQTCMPTCQERPIPPLFKDLASGGKQDVDFKALKHLLLNKKTAFAVWLLLPAADRVFPPRCSGSTVDRLSVLLLGSQLTQCGLYSAGRQLKEAVMLHHHSSKNPDPWRSDDTARANKAAVRLFSAPLRRLYLFCFLHVLTSFLPISFLFVFHSFSAFLPVSRRAVSPAALPLYRFLISMCTESREASNVALDLWLRPRADSRLVSTVWTVAPGFGNTAITGRSDCASCRERQLVYEQYKRSGSVMVGTQSYTLRLSSQNRLSLSRAGSFHGFALGL
ncbi:hypothetical protein FQN60_018439 [Etheostoma spectabile]|uniref:Uncharacterized protein n=1 Tax=Etheostoma spectabile TaxID=54343 RepID=A0A5J5DHY6_9PERO|nr:hypothetical protein FQN60_018439 [Etheostoma spectabile]